MQLTYYCRLYEASPYNMQIDRATFIALSLVKPKGLKRMPDSDECLFDLEGGERERGKENLRVK